jgi:hypothetical protein
VPAVESTLTDADRRRHPEFAAGIERERASFDYYLEARFGSLDRCLDDDERETYRRFMPDLLHVYQAHTGNICSSFYCKHLPAGAVRTDKPRMAVVHYSDEWGPAEQLLAECDGLYWEAIDYLGGSDKATFVERLFTVVTDVLGRLDARKTSTRWLAEPRPGTEEYREEESRPRGEHGDDPAIEALRGKLHDVRKFYRAAAPRGARLRYLLGVVYGIPATVLAGLILWLVLRASGVVTADARGLILASLVSGATGAVVSVMTRMSSDTLAIKHESGRVALLLVGMMRPLIGGVLGVALFAAVNGGLISLANPNGNAEIFYYAGLAFVAGFSERLAQDTLLESGASKLSAGLGQRGNGDGERKQALGQSSSQDGPEEESPPTGQAKADKGP